MRIFLRIGILSIVFWGLLLFELKGQAPGSLDSLWGNAGKIVLDLGPDEICQRLLTDANGNLYLFGNIADYTSGADLDFLIAKLNPDGTLDQQFGSNGRMTGDFGRFHNSRIVDATIKNEALYLLGEANNGGPQDTQQVFIGKLSLDGQWDATFGENGICTRQFVGTYASAGSLLVQEDGRIVFCGMTTDTNAWHIEMPLAARLLPDGRPDSSFRNTGCITWSLAHGLASARGHVATHGLSAARGHDATHGLSAARGMHNDGGKFETILPLSNGGYLLGGAFYTSNYGKAMLMAVDQHGYLDDGFGENGLLFPDINPGFTCVVTSAAKRGPDIYLGATLDVYSSGEDFALLHLDSTGTFLDYQNIDIQGNEDHIQDLMIDHNGRLLLAGYSRLPGSQSPGFESDGFAIAARNNPPEPATEFATNGQWFHQMTPGLESGANTLCETPDGKLIVAGYISANGPDNYTDLVLVKLLLDSIIPPPDSPAHVPVGIYPNPAHDLLHINIDGANDCTIWDAQGKRIMEATDLTNGIDISQLPTGVYLLETAGKCSRFLKH